MHGAQRSIERKLTERGKALKRQPVDLLVDCKQSERDWKIESRAFLANVGMEYKKQVLSKISGSLSKNGTSCLKIGQIRLKLP